MVPVYFLIDLSELVLHVFSLWTTILSDHQAVVPLPGSYQRIYGQAGAW